VKLAGEVLIHAPPETVWEIINDSKRMQKCMPGCTLLEDRGGDTYLAHLAIGVATLRGSFDAELRVTDKVPGQGYRLDVSAQGMTGQMRGGGTVALSPQGMSTLLAYAGELEVGGLLATMGQRFLGSVVEQMTAEFFQGLGKIAEATANLPQMNADKRR
jgi:hypothetical protein